MRFDRSFTGFTLIELVVVIVLSGIVAVLISSNLTRPLESFVDLRRRAELVDIAELALRRMTREIRLALPNSVRIRDGMTENLAVCDTATASGNICALEILRTLEGGRYRELPDGSNFDQCSMPDNDRLRFSSTNDCFEILGRFNSTPVDGGTSQLDCINGVSDCMVIYNTGQLGANAYNRDNIAAIEDNDPDGDTITDALTFIGAPPFPFKSPQQRFYIVDTPVSFICSSITGQINRFDQYVIPINQTTTPGGDQTLLANSVTNCTITYNPGIAQRSGLVTISITISQSSENISLLQQIHVFNVP